MARGKICGTTDGIRPPHQLVEIARAVFAKRGFRRRRPSRRIARRAKVSKPIVYEHFAQEGLYASSSIAR